MNPIPTKYLVKLNDLAGQRKAYLEMIVRLSNIVEDLQNKDSALELQERNVFMAMYEDLKKDNPGLSFDDVLVNIDGDSPHWKIRETPAETKTDTEVDDTEDRMGEEV